MKLRSNKFSLALEPKETLGVIRAVLLLVVLGIITFCTIKNPNQNIDSSLFLDLVNGVLLP